VKGDVFSRVKSVGAGTTGVKFSTRSAIHAFYAVANRTKAPYHHGLYSRLVAEHMALENRETEPSHDPMFDLIVEQELAMGRVCKWSLRLGGTKGPDKTQ
jgi:hypothetical protein